MSRSRLIWFIGLGGFAVAVSFGFLLRLEDVPAIRSLENSGQLCTPEIPNLAENIGFLLEATKYDNKWTLNGQPRRDGVNFYFFCPASDRASRKFQLYANNCAYVGRPNVVVCDARFLASFVVSRGIVGKLSSIPSERVVESRKVERDILLWVLGHEIGHILANDQPAHFQSNRLNEMISSSSVDQRKELMADMWFVQHLKLDGQRQASVEVMLSKLLYAQVRDRVGSAHLYPGTGVPLPDRMVEYAKGGTHPEFVFRATRMLSLSYDRPETLQFKRQIDDFAKALR